MREERGKRGSTVARASRVLFCSSSGDPRSSPLFLCARQSGEGSLEPPTKRISGTERPWNGVAAIYRGAGSGVDGVEIENKEEEQSSVVPCDFILAAAWPQHI